MFGRTTRRWFLHATAAGGAWAGLADLEFLTRLPAVSAADAATRRGAANGRCGPPLRLT